MNNYANFANGIKYKTLNILTIPRTMEHCFGIILYFFFFLQDILHYINYENNLYS